MISWFPVSAFSQHPPVICAGPTVTSGLECLMCWAPSSVCLVSAFPHPPSFSGMSQVAFILALLMLCNCSKVRPPSWLRSPQSHSSERQDMISCHRCLRPHPRSVWRSSGATTRISVSTFWTLYPPQQVIPPLSLLWEVCRQMQELLLWINMLLPQQGRCVTGPLTSMPAGLMDSLEPQSMSLALGSYRGILKVSLYACVPACHQKKCASVCHVCAQMAKLDNNEDSEKNQNNCCWFASTWTTYLELTF